MLSKHFRLVRHSRPSSGIDFRGQNQSAVFPVGVPRPGFLFSAHVGARGVDFVIALGLEVVEAFLVFGEGCYTGAGFFLTIEHVLGNGIG